MDTCGVCGEEIRFGRRGSDPRWSGPRWLHREDADHEPVHGVPLTPEKWAEIMANHEQQVADKASRKKKNDLKSDADEEPEDEGPIIIPPPEVPAIAVEPGHFPARSGIRQIISLAQKNGWEIVRLTIGRGPWIGATGKMLSISDVWVLGARGPEVDGVRRVGVACWRDGSFEFAQFGTLKAGVLTVTRGSSTDLKSWIKGAP